jgi:hypothetical protein
MMAPLTVPDLLFAIEDSREERWQVDEGRGTKRKATN